MVMTLVVDIEYLAAPTKEDVGRARRRLVWCNRLMNLLGWLVVATFLALLLIFVLASNKGSLVEQPAITVWSALGAVTVLLYGGVGAEWWLDVRSQIRQSICSLDPAKGEMGLEIAIWSKSDHAIETYRAAVVAQERLFTQLDYQAMKTWVEQAPKRRASVVHQHKIQQAWRDVYGGREELIALHG